MTGVTILGSCFSFSLPIVLCALSFTLCPPPAWRKEAALLCLEYRQKINPDLCSSLWFCVMPVNLRSKLSSAKIKTSIPKCQDQPRFNDYYIRNLATIPKEDDKLNLRSLSGDNWLLRFGWSTKKFRLLLQCYVQSGRQNQTTGGSSWNTISELQYMRCHFFHKKFLIFYELEASRR